MGGSVARSLTDILGAPELAPPSEAPDQTGGDPAVWTLLGEAGTDPKGQLAVASTYYNRARKLGRTAQAVVTDPGQGYEAWQDSKARSATQKRYPVGSPAYTAAQGVLTGVMSGQTPALPYTHFYGPKAQADKGRQPPNWATGTGTDIGGNRFYALDDVSSTAPDLTDILGAPELKGSAPDASAPSAEADKATKTEKPIPIVNADGKTVGYTTDAQSATVRRLLQEKKYDPNAPAGSKTHPYAYGPGTQPVRGGTWYVDPTSGALTQYHDPDKAGSTVAQLGTDAFEPAGSNLLYNWDKTQDPRAQAIESGFGSGLMFGGKNEAIAGLQSLPTGGRGFGSRLHTLDAEDAALRARFPIAHDTAAVGGAVTGGLLGDAAGNALLQGGIRAAPALAAAVEANPLLRTGATLAGRGAQGAGFGAAQGYLGTDGTESDRETAAGQGAVMGLILGEAVPPVIKLGRAVAGVGSGVNRLLEPLTETGRGKIADRLFVQRGEGSNMLNPDLTEYVPGSRPTTAQAYGNTGWATAERGIGAANSTPFTELARGNAAARDSVVSALKGDPAQREALVAARDAEALPLLQQAFANPKPVDPKPVVDKIDEILAGPAGERNAVRQVLGDIRRKIVNSVEQPPAPALAGMRSVSPAAARALATGAPVERLETDPAQLYGIRQAIGDSLTARGTGTESDARLATRELLAVRDALDPVIESGAPGFGAYRQRFAELSQPINEHDFLQSLNLTTPRGQITEVQVGTALKTIERLRLASGVNGAKSLSDETLQTLRNLQADLKREANSQLGRGTGSDTVQKAIENATTGGAALHPLAEAGSAIVGMAHPAVGFGARLGINVLGHYRGANRQRVLDAYINRLLDPDLAERALDNVRTPSVPPAFRIMPTVSSVVPILGTEGRNALMQPAPAPIATARP